MHPLVIVAPNRPARGPARGQQLALEAVEPLLEFVAIPETIDQLSAVRLMEGQDEFAGLTVAPGLDPEMLATPLEAPHHVCFFGRARLPL